MQEPAVLASSPRFFQKLGLTHDIRQFEDGLHTDPNESDSYEWWYFDSHLDNGSKLVITFFTKDAASPKGGLAPQNRDGSRPARWKKHQQVHALLPRPVLGLQGILRRAHRKQRFQRRSA